jgi:hypothetical protein
MCVRHLDKSEARFRRKIIVFVGFGSLRETNYPGCDGNYESLEKSCNRRWNSGSARNDRRFHRSSEQQERFDGSDRESPATGPLDRGERFGGNQAEDLREHRGKRIRQDHPPVRERG